MAQYQYERVMRKISDDAEKEEEEKKKQDSRSGWDKFWGGVGDAGKAVGSFIGDTLQSIPRGVVNIGLTLKEAGRNWNLDNENNSIDTLLKISQSDRERLLSAINDPNKSRSLSDDEWGKAFMLKQANNNFGGIDDDTLKSRKEKNKATKNTHETYKAGNDFTKFVFGGEEDEVAQSAQKTDQDITNFGKEKLGLSNDQASALGLIGAAGLTALDAPTGGGQFYKSAIKTFGKKGIESLAKETTESGIKQMVKKAIPKITDNALNDLAPKLAQTTDTRSVREILRTAPNLTDTIGGKISSAKGTVSQKLVDTFGRNSTDELANTAVDTSKTISSRGARYAGEDDMDAVSKLLGRVKTSAELKSTKNGFWQNIKEQFADKLSPVNDLVSTIEKQTGKTLSTEDNPYRLMRLYQGMPDRVQQRISELTSVLKEAPDLDAVTTIGVARQIRSRTQRGITSFIDDKTANRAVQQWYNRLGQDGFDKAQNVVEAVQKYNRGLLDDLHEAGIISDDALKAIQDTGTDYFARFNVIDYIMKNDKNRALFSRSGSYNETKQALNKVLATAKGMEEGTEILDPIESIVRSTDSTMRAVAKNEIWQSFNRLADDVPDLVVRVRDPENVAERIALSLDNQELRPVRNKLNNMIRSNNRSVRRLETEINRLNKQGLSKSLRDGGQRMTQETLVDPARLGGNVPTSQIGRQGATTVRQGDETVRGFMDMVNPQQLGTRDTGRFVRNLIENGNQNDINRIKNMIGNRDAKLASLLDDIGNMKVQYDDIAGTIRKNTDEAKGLADAAVPDGFELITGFGKGIEGKLAVPKEIADVYTGKNAAQRDYVTSMVTNINSFVKQNLTSNNIAFALFTNPARDFKSFAMNSKSVKSNPISILKAYSQGLFGRLFQDADYKDMIASGGKSGFYADERTAEKLAQDLIRNVSGKRILGVKVAPIRNTREFIREASRVLTAPLRTARDALHGAASVLEDAPRLAEFKAAKRLGKSSKEAAFDARNVTVDFQQSGRVAQTINAWIPFLNARLQGTLKSAEAIKRNPARALSVYATLTAAPIWLAQANNMRYPDVMKNISDTERDNNFVIVLGDAKDKDGRYTQVLKIPKSDIDKVLGDPMEQLARYVYNDDPDNFQEVLTNLVGNTLPFDTVRDGKFSLERTVGSLTPPILKAPLESVTNRNLYYGSDIVPESLQDLPNNEQVRDSTSTAARFLANLTGTSPLKADNTIRSFTGTIATKNPIDQVSGKVIGASGNKMNDEFYSTLEKTRKNRASASKYINEAIGRGDLAAAQQAAQTYNQYLIQAFTPFGQRFGDQMTQELADIYDEQKIILTRRSVKQRQRNQLNRQSPGE